MNEKSKEEVSAKLDLSKKVVDELSFNIFDLKILIYAQWALIAILLFSMVK